MKMGCPVTAQIFLAVTIGNDFALSAPTTCAKAQISLKAKNRILSFYTISS